MSSSFSQIVRGFQLQVPAGRTYRVVFLALREPKTTAPVLRVFARDADGNLHSPMGASVNLYYCDGALYHVLQNGLDEQPRP